MSSPAALQHQLTPHQLHDPPHNTEHILPSSSPSQSSTQPQPPTPSPPAPPSQDKSLSPGPQHILPDVTTIIDPPTHLNTSLDGQSKLPESASLDQQQHQEVKTEVVEPTLGQINGTIELVEHPPGTITIEEATNAEEASEWVQEGDQMKRVKVYELVGSRWVDQGTAFCFGQFQEETGEALLIARAERDFSDVILRTVIRSNDVYQRQQDTLIVWTEPDGVDYALSFQDPEGCSEVWNFITEVQQHMNNVEESNGFSSPVLGSDGSVTTASIIRSGHLPPPQLGIIGEIERAIKALARTQPVRERICEYIQQEEYIKSLIEVLSMAEDLESLENLHALCSLMQTILMLNDHTLYEHILEDELFYGVVGMLEYDPDFPSHKANYRDFLKQSTQFHQPIPIHDPIIQRKIHHTYRLQFLKDVVLARALDDSTFNVLNSCIIFNQIDIISHIQQDQTFLKEIVRLFVDEEVLTGGAQRYQMQLQMMQQQQQQMQMQQRLQGPVVISLPSADQEDVNGMVNGDHPNVKKEDDSMDVDSVPKQATPSPPAMQPVPLVPISPPPPTSPKLPMNGIAVVNGRGTTPTTAPQSLAPNPRAGAYSFAPPDDLTEAEINQRREVVLLIQQLCIMGKNVQLPARMALFRILVDRGILFAVQWAMNLPESIEKNKQMISAGGEVLAALLDHDLNGVRGHVLKQILAIEKERTAGKRGADKAETLLEMVCRIMARSKDLAVQSLVGDALKVWMDTPSVDSIPVSVGEASHAVAPKIPARKDDPGTERFLDYFYNHCVHILFKPLMELQEWKNCKENVLTLPREQSNRYVYLCDLLFNFIQQHYFRSSFYVLSANNILSRIATILRAKEKHLRHASFRIFRLLLKQNNTHIQGLVMKHDVLKPILDLTLQESRRDNLLSCSCQEYFESMRRDNMKDLIKFCMVKHEEDIRKLAETPLGGQRFELLMRRYEMNNEPPPKETEPEKPVDTRPRPGQNRFPEAEEEDYFNGDDDEDDVVLPSISQQARTNAGVAIPAGALSPGKILNTNPNVNTLKRRRRGDVSGRGHKPSLKTPPLRPLVDYGEEEEEEGAESKQMQQQEGAIADNAKLASSPIPNTVKLAGSPPKRVPKETEDDEDAVLESLVRGRALTPGPKPDPSLSQPPARLGEKRRRGDGDDEDDEPLSRLTRQKKQQTTALSTKQQQQHQKTATTAESMGAGARQKNGDDPPKKIKVKIGFGTVFAGGKTGSNAETVNTPNSTASPPTASENNTSLTKAASPLHSPTPTLGSSPMPSDRSTKDGDTG